MSGAQLDLIKLLMSKSLQVVGDGDQSIYSCRGAYAESMSDFVDEFDDHLVDGSNDIHASFTDVDALIYGKIRREEWILYI